MLWLQIGYFSEKIIEIEKNLIGMGETCNFLRRAGATADMKCASLYIQISIS